MSMSAGADLDVARFPPIWLIVPEEVDVILEQISRCDFVFCQRLSDDFIHAELSTSVLRQAFGGKIISWPNIYFDGYFPGISYRYNLNGKVLGPLDEYHWDLIEEFYKSGRSVGACVEFLASDDVLESRPDPVGESLFNLAAREAGLSVVISDYVATMLHHRRLFYSMNHPVNDVLEEMLQRLFAEAGERHRVKAFTSSGAALDKIILPVLPAVAARHRMNFASDLLTKGVEVAFEQEGYRVTDRPRYYSLAELVETFYRTYECDRARGAS